MPDQSKLWIKVTQIVSNIEAQLSQNLQSKHGLGLSEFKALQWLAASPKGELRMQDLADHLHLNQSSTTRLVERLERDGHTVRDLCPDDKRGVYAVLTDAGRKRLAGAVTDYEEALKNALKEYGETDLFSAKVLGIHKKI